MGRLVDGVRFDRRQYLGEIERACREWAAASGRRGRRTCRSPTEACAATAPTRFTTCFGSRGGRWRRRGSPRADRQYRNLPADGGFDDVTVEVYTVVFTDAAMLSLLTRIAGQACTSGAVGREQALRWVAEQRRRAEIGRFLIAVPFFVAAASAPPRSYPADLGTEQGAFLLRKDVVQLLMSRETGVTPVQKVVDAGCAKEEQG